MNEPIDNPDLQPTQSSQALMKPDMALADMEKIQAPALTPQQARVEAVANVLHKAYEKASTLQLTPEEVKALKADFPHDAFKLGAGGNEKLLYIEHPYLRDRFDEVIGMGQWALVRSKPHWAEEFVTQKGQKAVRIYADCALLIRGCLVSEAIGEMIYYPNNALQSYGDAAEGSETAAFRRCAKKIGVGLQAWKKDFCEAWMKGKQNPQAKTYVVQSHKAEEKPAPKATTFDEWLDKCKAKFLELTSKPPILAAAWQYAVEHSWILETEQLSHVRPSKMFPSLVYMRVKGQTDADLIAANKTAIAEYHKQIMAEIGKIVDAEPNPDWQSRFAAAYAHDDFEKEPDESPQEEHLGDGSPEEASDKGIKKIGEIVAVSVKHGQSSRGKWTCYGIKIGDDWFNTFDTKLGKELEAKKNQYVTIECETTERGKTVLKLL